MFKNEVSMSRIKSEAKKVLGPAIKAGRKLTKIEALVLALLREKKRAHMRRLY